MSREEIRKLLGGYATGTLTEAERQALFEAALEDQELFDELAREETLREVLAAPAARAQLLEALEERRVAPSRRGWRWLRRPQSLALAGALAASVLLVAVLARRPTPPPAPEIAALRLPEPDAPQAPPVQLPPAPPAPPAEMPEAPAVTADSGARGVVGGVPGAMPEESTAVAGARPNASGGSASELYYRADAPSARLLNAPAEAQRRAAKRAAVIQTQAAHLGMRYTVQHAESDGAFVPAAPDRSFRTGERLRLATEVNDTARLSVFRRDVAAGWRRLFDGPVQPRTSYIVPAGDALVYDAAGDQEILAVVSRPEAAAVDPARLEALSLAARPGQMVETTGGVTYAVSAAAPPASQQIVLRIVLRIR